MERLYAKTPIVKESALLTEHSRAVFEASLSLFGEKKPSKMADSWLRLFGVPTEKFVSFRHNLSLAAIFHDIGKANSGFQNALNHKGEQAIRHEHLSALILWLPEMRKWINSCDLFDYEIILSAVISHHLKINDTSEHFIPRLVPVDGFAVFCDHPDFEDVINLAERYTRFKAPDLSKYSGIWRFRSLDKKSLKDHMYVQKRKRLKDPDYRRLLLSVKAALNVSDSAGSALIREGKQIDGWLMHCFESKPISCSDIEEMILKPRQTEIERHTGKPFEIRNFQIGAGKLGSRALLIAGCGSGKTLAAWKWVQNQSRHHNFSRVLFLYPTRATATEGFRDYVSWAGEENAALMHGTSEYDLEGLFSNPDDIRNRHDYTSEQRLFALGYWPKRIFSATVDSFLSFMSNSYSGICMIPLLADSVIIFDEVHSFDRSMFTALETFLREFDNVPVLCMTASLTNDRMKTLIDTCSLERYPDEELDDLLKQTRAPRYSVLIVERPSKEIVGKYLDDGQRVLWVSNTVERCQRVYEDFKDFCNNSAIPALCYHSRFRLQDRKTSHEKLINLFRHTKGAIFAATTQVCEMSLDLDADVLITEMAPMPSIIQRMGRCCRVENPGDRRGIVVMYPPENEKPYTREEIEQCRIFAQELESKEASQEELSHLLENLECLKPHIEGGYTGFMDSGWYAMGSDDSFRDGHDFTVDCVLDEDVDHFNHLNKTKPEQSVGLIVPVPKRFVCKDRLVGKRLSVAPASMYDADSGFNVRRI